MARRAAREMLFELDGPEMAPKTVDSLVLLNLAESYFRLIVSVAKAQGLGLSLRGIQIQDKCVAVSVTPSDARAARIAATRALRIVSGDERPPDGVDTILKKLRASLRDLPPNATAAVRVGKWHRTVAAPRLPIAESPWETTELRVVPVRVGGRSLTAWLTSESEDAPFTVDVTIDQARKLGASLQEQIDVVLDVCRDVDGNIESGRVVEVVSLDDTEPTETWRKWFATNAPEWDDIENVSEALGRH